MSERQIRQRSDEIAKVDKSEFFKIRLKGYEKYQKIQSSKYTVWNLFSIITGKIKLIMKVEQKKKKTRISVF